MTTQATRAALVPLIAAHARTHDGRSHRFPHWRAQAALIEDGAQYRMAVALVEAAEAVGERIRKTAGASK